MENTKGLPDPLSKHRTRPTSISRYTPFMDPPKSNTTKGGAVKTKFAPNLAAATKRPTAAPSSIEVPLPPSSGTTASGRGGRHAARGRGGASSRGGVGRLLAQPEVVSGPFSHGPAAASKLRSASAASLVGGPRLGSNSTSLALAADAQSSAAHSCSAPRNSNAQTTLRGRDETEDIDEYFANREHEENLPITLSSVSKASKGDPEKSENSVEEKTNAAIADDVYRNGGCELLIPGKLMLFQLPACLPPLQCEDDALAESSKVAPMSSLLGEEKERVLDLETFKSNQEALEAQQLARSQSQWPLNAEGHYGKLRVHASGRLSLLINGQAYTALPSTTCPDVMGTQRAVAIDTEYGQSFDLGTIQQSLLFTPQLEHLLASQHL